MNIVFCHSKWLIFNTTVEGSLANIDSGLEWIIFAEGTYIVAVPLWALSTCKSNRKKVITSNRYQWGR